MQWAFLKQPEIPRPRSRQLHTRCTVALRYAYSPTGLQPALSPGRSTRECSIDGWAGTYSVGQLQRPPHSKCVDICGHVWRKHAANKMDGKWWPSWEASACAAWLASALSWGLPVLFPRVMLSDLLGVPCLRNKKGARWWGRQLFCWGGLEE